MISLAKNNSVTIFISSHILSEISKIANRIGIIHNGKLLQELNSNELDSLIKKRLVIQTRNNDAAKKLLVKNGYNPVFTDNGEIELTDEKAIKKSEDVAVLLVQASNPPVSICLKEEDLEAYFLRIIKRAKVPDE